MVPQTPYFRYLWTPCWGVTRRYPNQYAILDSFGTPCFLRADLRTSFLTYIMRTANTRVRRYEFGNVMRMGAKKQVVEKLRGLLKLQLASISSTSGGSVWCEW